VKFAIGADASPTSFESISQVSDPRIQEAVWKAIQGCQWRAGTDPEGRPASLWVILPLRLVPSNQLP